MIENRIGTNRRNLTLSQFQSTECSFILVYTCWCSINAYILGLFRAESDIFPNEIVWQIPCTAIYLNIVLARSLACALAFLNHHHHHMVFVVDFIVKDIPTLYVKMHHFWADNAQQISGNSVKKLVSPSHTHTLSLSLFGMCVYLFFTLCALTLCLNIVYNICTYRRVSRTHCKPKIMAQKQIQRVYYFVFVVFISSLFLSHIIHIYILLASFLFMCVCVCMCIWVRFRHIFRVYACTLDRIAYKFAIQIFNKLILHFVL